MKQIELADVTPLIQRQVFIKFKALITSELDENGKPRRINAFMISLGFDKNEDTKLSTSLRKSLATSWANTRKALSSRSLIPYLVNGEILLLKENPSLDKLIEKQLLIGGNKEKLDWYLCYYPSSRKPKTQGNVSLLDEIEVGLLVVNYPANEASIFFFDPQRVGKSKSSHVLAVNESKYDEFVQFRYHGSLHHISHETFVSFDQRIITRTNLVDRAHLLIVFQNNNDNKTRRLLDQAVGSFAGWGLVSGICAIEQCSIESALSTLMTKTIHAKYRQLLAGRAFSYDRDKEAFTVSNHEKLIKEILQYVGEYEGFSLANSSSSSGINVFRFSIAPSGRIAIQTAYPKKEHIGHIYRIDQNKYFSEEEEVFLDSILIGCRLNYSFKLGYEQMSIILRKPRKTLPGTTEKDGLLVGCYADQSHEEYHIFSGRVLLRKLNDDDKIRVRRVLFSKRKQLDSLITKYKFLLPFFGGLQDHLSDDIYTSLPKKMERVLRNRINLVDTSRRDHFKGLYRLYYPSSRTKETLYERVLEIGTENDETIWYDYSQGKTEEKFFGTATIFEDILSIRFNELRKGKQSAELADRFIAVEFDIMELDSKASTIYKCKMYRQDHDDKPVISEALIVLAEEENLKTLLEKSLKSIKTNDLAENDFSNRLRRLIPENMRVTK